LMPPQLLIIGIVGDVVEADKFEQVFLAYCHKIAEVATLVARQTKPPVDRIGMPENLDRLIRDEFQYTLRRLTSSNRKEAVGAIFEKRQSLFTGR